MFKQLLLVFGLVVFSTGADLSFKESVGAANCPRGYARHGEYCFFAGTNKVTWYEALQICKFVADRNELAEICNKDIQDFLTSYVQDKGDYGEFWVGGTNIMDNTTYVWNRSHGKVNPELWDENEPSNTNNAEHCTEFRRNGRLNDNDCHAHRMYICMTRRS